ncbi:PaaI family thioesterase [Chloroflexota bacterium]
MSNIFAGTRTPFAELVGFEFQRLDDECSECVLETREDLLNNYGTVHGGAICTVVDGGMGAALWPYVAEGEQITTIEVKVNYLGAVRAGVLKCTSKVVQKTRKLAFVESEVTNNGHLVAKATGTYYVSRSSKAKSS